MDDFGVKYWSKEDKNYLYNAVGANFRYTVDHKGEHYCRLTLN